MKTKAYLLKREYSRKKKQHLIGKEIVVKNGKKLVSQWRVISGIDDPSSLTAKRRPAEEIGVIDLDFNNLAGSDFALVEVFLRFWPGDATKQLEKLNCSFRCKHKGNHPLVTLK